jgi:hypothetical protein
MSFGRWLLLSRLRESANNALTRSSPLQPRWIAVSAAAASAVRFFGTNLARGLRFVVRIAVVPIRPQTLVGHKSASYILEERLVDSRRCGYHDHGSREIAP